MRKDPGDPVLSGSFCTAGSCDYVAERVGKEAYAQQLTADARLLVRRATPLQIRFKRIVRVLLIATAALGALLLVSAAVRNDDLADAIKNTTATISSVVPEGLLLGMTVAFSVGAVRLSRRGAIVQDINAVEAMNYLDVVCLDKTGTITANELSLRETIWLTDDQSLLQADRGWLGAFAAAGAGESRTAAALADGLAADSNGARPAGGCPSTRSAAGALCRLRPAASSATSSLAPRRRSCPTATMTAASWGATRTPRRPACGAWSSPKPTPCPIPRAAWARSAPWPC